MKESKNNDGPLINEEIKAPKVRLIGPEGEMIGVLDRKDALQKAYEYGLDLVEISPNAEPPVCKILDNGKYKYEMQKKKNEAKKKQKTIEIKELQIGPLISTNDFDVKRKAAEKFLKDGNKVKIVMRFKGRQMSHPEIGMEVIERFKNALVEQAKIETTPKLEGKQILMILGPKTN